MKGEERGAKGEDRESGVSAPNAGGIATTAVRDGGAGHALPMRRIALIGNASAGKSLPGAVSRACAWGLLMNCAGESDQFRSHP